MKKLKLIDWIINSGLPLEEQHKNSITLLSKCITDKHFEFLSFFNVKWNDEITDLYFNNLEDDITFRPDFIDEEAKKYFIKKLLINYYYDEFLCTYYRYYDDSDIKKQFKDGLSEANINPTNIRGRLSNDREVSVLIEAGRVDLLIDLLYQKYWDEEDKKNIGKYIVDFHKCLRIYLKDIPDFLLTYNNGEHLCTLLENGITFYIESYSSYHIFRDIANNNDRFVDLLIENAKKDESIIIYLYKFERLGKDDRLLEIVLNSPNVSTLLSKIGSSNDNRDAWILSNQQKYLNLWNQNKVNGFPYKPLYLEYMRNTGYWYSKKNDKLNYKDNKNLEELGYIINTYSNSDIIDKDYLALYKLLVDVDSPRTLRLIRALLDDDFNNINRLFDSNGNMTSYLEQYLLYDYSYLKYAMANGINVLDKIDNKNHAGYVKLLLKYRDMDDYLLIDYSNVDSYFNDGKPNRLFVECLLDSRKHSLLLTFIKDNVELELSDIEKYIVEKMATISDNKLKSEFLSYCINNLNDLTVSNIDVLILLFQKVITNNSHEIRKNANKILPELLKKDNPYEALELLEYVYTSGDVPEFGKRFATYNIIFGNNRGVESSGSPILYNSTVDEQNKIIIWDLFRISLGSGEGGLKRYLEELKEGNRVLCELIANDQITSEVPDEYKEIIASFRRKIEFLAKYILGLEYESGSDIKTIVSIASSLKLSYLVIKGKTVWATQIVDAIIDKLFGDFGFHNIAMVDAYAARCDILKKVREEARYMYSRNFKIQKGDLFKGVDSKYLDNILRYGSLCQEFLGEDIGRDVTPLDTDVSYIDRDDYTISSLMNSGLTARSYGDLKLIISPSMAPRKNDFIITRDSKTGLTNNTVSAFDEYELYSRSSSDHYGIRTGFPPCYIKALIYDKNDVYRIKFLLVKNDNYIPIYNSREELLFTLEEFMELKKSKEGLTHYGENHYNISDNLSSPSLLGVADTLVDNSTVSNHKKAIIFSYLKPVIEKYFKGVKTIIDSSINNGILEIIDTGSTGRGTNVANDSDFDFLFRVDHSFKCSPLYNSFCRDIAQALGISSSGDIIRAKDVKLPGLDETLQIDITFISKTNKIQYSTDGCLKDRLSTIRRLYPDKYPLVVANIVEAKRLFKEAHCYKPSRKDSTQGGIGGVGLENFILQHGGSLYDAAKDFLSAYEKYPTLTEFAKNYHIFDYGENNFTFAFGPARSPYDDYVENLNSGGFERTVALLKKYVYEFDEAKKIEGYSIK